MTARRVLVVGGGVAGAAAAWAARGLGATVSLVRDRVGASGLGSGAADFHPWEQPSASTCALPARLLEFSTALGAWCLPEAGAQVITREGNLRPARGAQLGVLNLAELAGREVGVPDLQRLDWDAARLCKALAQQPFVREHRLRFVPLRVPLLRYREEETCASADLAESHDEAERVEWLAEKFSRHGVDAWLCGPWLGLRGAASTRLEQLLKLPVGETLSDVGEAAGQRLQVACDRLLVASGVSVVEGRVTELAAAGTKWQASVDRDVGEPVVLEASRVVVATGGVAAGGIRLTRTNRGDSGGPTLELNFAADLPLELDGELLESASSLHGFDFEGRGRGVLERVGLAPDRSEPHRVLGQPRLFSAGDVRAGLPRTVLAAAFSGLVAGAAAGG